VLTRTRPGAAEITLTSRRESTCTGFWRKFLAMNASGTIQCKIAGARKYYSARSMAAIGLTLLGGCSWFLPHPEKSSNIIGDADTPQDGRCSLAVAQARKSLFGQIVAAGVPKPLIVHAQFASSNRDIRNGQSIYFVASTRDTDPPREFAGVSRHQSKGEPTAHSEMWQLKNLNRDGEAAAGDTVLLDRALIELRELQGGAEPPRAELSRFIIYKADVPDPTRPTTCDAQIRDEDFVFMRALDPSTWAGVTATGSLEVQRGRPGRTTVPDGSNKNPDCAREEERCHTDAHGGLVCAWAPVCGE
jgi:hypothetical protein